MSKKVKFYIPVILWCLLIFVLSSIPGLKITKSGWDFILRKGDHVFMYLVFFLLTYRALINIGPESFSKENIRPEIWLIGSRIYGFNLHIKMRASVAVSFIFCALYAISDEIHHAFVPNRSGAFSDVFINIAGSILAVILIKFYEKTAT